MRSRLRAAVVTTFVIALVLTGVGAVVAKTPEQRDQIRAANRVAAKFEASLDRSVASASVAVKRQHDADQDGYPALLKVVEARIAKLPRIRPGGTTAYGREHSGDYQDAKDLRAAAVKPLTDLRAYLLTSAIPDSKFIAAGKKLVALRPGALLGDAPVSTGEPLLKLVLPAYEKARKQLKKQDAPHGSELLLLDLTTYANDLVSETKAGAKKIDSGKAFYFRLGERPIELLKRLVTLESAIQVQVGNQVDIVAASQ